MRIRSWSGLLLLFSLSVSVIVNSFPSLILAQTAEPAELETPQAEPLNAPYVATPQIVVDRMLELAELKSDDIVYDLGSGDGRVVITAAQKFGVRGVGIELDPDLIQVARANAEAAGVADRVEFRQADIFETDFSEATVVTLYLLPEVNLRLRPRLLSQLKPGTRIISHGFDMGNWRPEETVVVPADRLRILYKWTVPAEIPADLRSSRAETDADMDTDANAALR
jgi:SAM-dependent methyltransferase